MKKIIDKSSSNLLIDDLLIKSEKQIYSYFNHFFPSITEKINNSIIKGKKLFWKKQPDFSFSNIIARHKRTNKFIEKKQSKWSKYYTKQYLHTI